MICSPFGQRNQIAEDDRPQVDDRTTSNALYGCHKVNWLHCRLQHIDVYVLRAAINQFMLCAAPASALPKRKIVMEMSITGRRPNTSARRPENGRIAVLARPYADPIHTKLSPPCSSLVMVGTAVDTAVMSRALRKLATTTAMNDSQNAEPFEELVEGNGVRVVIVGVAKKHSGGHSPAMSTGDVWRCNIRDQQPTGGHIVLFWAMRAWPLSSCKHACARSRDYSI